MLSGANTPTSVIIPPVNKSAGVTSNAGFQQFIPIWNQKYMFYIHFNREISALDISFTKINDKTKTLIKNNS